MNDSPGALQSLSERVDQLEKRVRALEQPALSTAQVRRDDLQPASAAKSKPAPSQPALETGSLFPVIGRALLGIAGAYVLRAIAEAGVLPKLPLSIIAVAYAFGWLVWSARVSHEIKRTVYATTSALILAPMLWENTLVFHLFTPTATAGVLAAFLTLATVLELRSPGLRGMAIAQAVAMLTTAALGFTTLQSLPFMTALLIALGISEFARSRDLPQPLWPLLVLVADTAVLAMLFIYSGSAETRALYPVLSTAALIAPPSTLFVMNAASIAVRLVAHTCRIMILETLQLMISFGLMAATLFLFAPARGAIIIGIVCLILSACSYACALRYLAPRAERRSFRIVALWSAALLVAGSIGALPLQGAAALLSAAAITATYLAKRTEPETLEFHGTLFVLSASVTAGLPAYLYSCVAGTPPHSLPAIIPVVSACAIVVLVLGSSSPETVSQRLLHLLRASIPVCAFSALLIHGALTLAGTLFAPGAHHVAFLRTLAMCAVAFAIAFTGSRWARPELTQLAWAALAVVGVKLLLEDLRHGHMGLVAASIAIFAVTLMSVPRMVRIGSQMRSGAAHQLPHTPSREVSV